MRRRRRRRWLRRRTRRALVVRGRAPARRPPAHAEGGGDDDDGAVEPHAELARLIAGAVRVHLPRVDELTAHGIADTALRAYAARTRRPGGGHGDAAGPDRGQRQRGGWPWWAVGEPLLAVAGGALAGLALARLVG